MAAQSVGETSKKARYISCLRFCGWTYRSIVPVFFGSLKKKNLIGNFIRNNFVTWSRRKNRKFGRESNDEIP